MRTLCLMLLALCCAECGPHGSGSHPTRPRVFEKRTGYVARITIQENGEVEYEYHTPTIDFSEKGTGTWNGNVLRIDFPSPIDATLAEGPDDYPVAPGQPDYEKLAKRDARFVLRGARLYQVSRFLKDPGTATEEALRDSAHGRIYELR